MADTTPRSISWNWRPSAALTLGSLALAALAGCSGSEEPTADAPADTEAVLARARAAAHFSDDDRDAAFEAIRELVEREDAAAEDLIRAVNILFDDSDFEGGRPYLERALAVAPNDPAVHWGLYRLAEYDGDFEGAVDHVRRAHELAPDDFPTELALANALAEVGRKEEAERHYEELKSRGADFGGSWLVTTIYRYHVLLRSDPDRQEEAGEYLAEFQRLKEAGLSAPGESERLRGTFGVVRPPRQGEVTLATPEDFAAELGADRVTGRLASEPVASVAQSVGTVGGIAPMWPVERGTLTPVLVDGDELAHVDSMTNVPESLLVWGESGLFLARREAAGRWSVESILDEPVTLASPFHIRRDEAKDPELKAQGQRALLAATSEGLRLLIEEDGSWVPRRRPVLRDFEPSDLRPVDFDHDGDLDLLVVGEAGVRLLRNDGLSVENGGLVDATRDAGLPFDTGFAWCTTEDLDVDQDVDLVLGGGAGGIFVASNERGGLFSDVTSALPEPARAAGSLLVHDLFPNGWPDLVAATPQMLLWANEAPGRWTQRTGGAGPDAPDPRTVHVVDLYGDATQRVLWPAPSGDGGEGGIRAVAPRGASRELETLLGASERELGGLALLDVDGDGKTDVLDASSSGLRASLVETNGHVLRLVLRGEKDNYAGLGAIVEVRAGPLYRRHYGRGQPIEVGVGMRETVDVVQITWPNGVVQNLTDLAPGTYLVQQKPGAIGSCPFLYTWNGETYEFISDVLGITPLGLPMAPGQLVPPDHDEFVLVKGEQLAPKDGAYELQFTEELREVTYLDRIRLDVVDHPEGTEIFPNERFCFPPFPEHHVHSVRAPLAPLRATGSDGADWTAALAADDRDLARPFEPLWGQYLGLANPHFLELEFDPERTRDASRLRFVMSGWFYWTDASVNVAAARHPEIEFVPPLLQVPDGEGGWRTVGPPLGFPAGKMKTMVVDVTEHVDRENPRVRIFSTLQLYWDSIRLAVDDDDAELRVTSLEPASANLWERGFSAAVAFGDETSLEWFDWEHTEDEPRWNQHPGLYTRFGETVSLLGAIDDRFVIMGSGDALTVRFDAEAAPPLPDGWRRDFLVFLDGWAKDRDPNTEEALYVEPLPFHGMSGYPYGADESFPNTEEHRAWRSEWNTRPAKRLIESLVPEAGTL